MIPFQANTNRRNTKLAPSQPHHLCDAVEFLSKVADVVTVHTGLLNSHQASNNPVPITQNTLLSILECACASATFRYKRMCHPTMSYAAPQHPV